MKYSSVNFLSISISSDNFFKDLFKDFSKAIVKSSKASSETNTSKSEIISLNSSEFFSTKSSIITLALFL